MERYLDTYTIRRKRMKQLIAQYERDTGVGVAEVARRTGIKPSHISAYQSDGSPKNIGPKAARQIERGCGLPPGWLDTMDEAADALAVVARVLEQIPDEAWNPLTRRLAVRIAELALKEGWTETTMQQKVEEYLRLAG